MSFKNNDQSDFVPLNGSYTFVSLLGVFAVMLLIALFCWGSILVFFSWELNYKGELSIEDTLGK